MKGLIGLGIAPGATLIVPYIVKAAARRCQPQLFGRRLSTEHKDHTVTECGVYDAFSAADIDIIGQPLQRGFYRLESLINLFV